MTWVGVTLWSQMHQLSPPSAPARYILPKQHQNVSHTNTFQVVQLSKFKIQVLQPGIQTHLPPPTFSPKVTNLLLLLSVPRILCCENHIAFSKVTRDMLIARFQSIVHGSILLEVSAPSGTRRLPTSPAFLTVSLPYSILVFFLTAAPLYLPVSLAPLPPSVHVKL